MKATVAISTNSVLVTGATGFIGNELLRAFKARGWLGYGLIRHRGVSSNEISQVTKYDVQNITKILLQIHPTVLIHAAGSSSVGSSVSNPDADFRDSVLLFQGILDAVRLSGLNFRVVYLSSASVYGQPKTLPVTEDCRLNPISPYGYHKKICEELAQEYTQCYQIPTSVARIFSVFGVGQRRLLIWDLLRKFLDDKCVQLSGTGEETRDFLHIDDLVTQIFQLVENAQLPHEVFNLGSGEARSVSQVAESVRRILGSSKEIVFDGSIRPGDPRAWQADISRLERQFGPPFIHDFEVRLAQTIEGWLK
jgi:UDP-glucose 4-epimerase